MHVTDARHVYEDQWGEIIDRPAADLVELRWYDSTESMSAQDFQAWLLIFAEHVLRLRRSFVLIDSTRFLMDPARLDNEWRFANIIPRYNAAGVRRLAFQFPDGVPAIGTPPAPEGPATFPTAYFGRRQEALDWLAG